MILWRVPGVYESLNQLTMNECYREQFLPKNQFMNHLAYVRPGEEERNKIYNEMQKEEREDIAEKEKSMKK